MSETSPSEFYRLVSTPETMARIKEHGQVQLSPDLASRIRPGNGLIVAGWDEDRQLGTVDIVCVITAVDISSASATVEWRAADITLRPNPSGRRWWRTPFFRFAPAVVERYMLQDLFAEYFPQYSDIDLGAVSGRGAGNEPRTLKTPGFVYVIRSKYGHKIGKTTNIKSRTRLFEVKLPFPIDLVHYAYFDDYTKSEREIHQMFAAKRLEGEWFDLDEDDVSVIRALGQVQPV